eukprot:CAMPEP_0196811634 /NCGR_PEP_ID=MMETSP1362-20130617/19315_1 /TAXON_ID=163516 /ORGANISM="Leptocylindrus danicus, Strain CCMP1856" /LENGTH=77 /DNA_ID=CAMNT_0042186989 /DNA_START=62 /DNA_END=295 /DNA_ORIENTATION=-
MKLAIFATACLSAVSAFAPAFVPRTNTVLKAESEFGAESDAAYAAIIAAGGFTPVADDGPFLTGGPEDLEEDWAPME